MQYRLIQGSANDTTRIVQTVLLNRGIKEPEKYLNLTEGCVCDWRDLDNIDRAVECFDSHFERGDVIAVLIDSDP